MEPTVPNAEPVAQPTAPVAEPVAPVTPEAPTVEPAKPVVDSAQEAEDKEWDDVTDELFPGISKPKKAEEKKSDEPAKPAEKPEAPAEEKKPDEAAKPDENEEEVSKPDTAAMDARIAARQSAQAVAEVKADVRKQMFGNIPSEMRDADGDPISSVEDVMRLVNPATSEPFTQEEATLWLTAARQQFNQQQAELDQRINGIAEVNVDLKDQADIINYRYGELLKAMPELRDRLWAQYQKTLAKDAKSGIITGAPVSLFEFYETALEPYAAVGRQAESEEAAKVVEATKQAEEQKKVQTRQDRSDIYGGSQVDDKDPDSKEWADAAEKVFGPKK